MTFHGAVEAAITHLLYKRRDHEPHNGTTASAQGSTTYGFPAPLYCWLHNSLNPLAAVEREADMAITVLRHAVRHTKDLFAQRSCAVVCGSNDVRDAILQRVDLHFPPSKIPLLKPLVVTLNDIDSLHHLAPSSPGLSSSPNHRHYHHRHVVIMCLGGAASPKLADAWRGPVVAQAFGLPSDALIVIAHSLWPAVCPAPHPIGVGFRKLQEESWQCGDTSRDGLVSAVIPLCCGVHPHELKAITSEQCKGAVPFEICQRICGASFPCQRSHHVCLERCHPAAQLDHHTRCPFQCNRKMECLHTCRMACGEACDCLETVRVEYSCFHDVAVGPVDEHTGVAPTRRHHHVFEGPCNRSKDPCEVAVPLTCRHCNADMKASCHVVAAARAADAERHAAGLDLNGSDDVPLTTLDLLSECQECLDIRKRLRTEVRIELLEQAEHIKVQRKREMEGQRFEQDKSAKSGVFIEGQRVAIKNIAGVRGPIDVLFPNVQEDANNGWNLSRMEDLLGEHGKIVARCIDFVDTQEVLYLVALARGGHTVVADVGLELLKAVVHSTTGLGHYVANTDDSFGQRSVLLITGGPSGSSAFAPSTTANDQAHDEMARIKARFPVGSAVYCTLPAPRLPIDVTVDSDINFVQSVSAKGDDDLRNAHTTSPLPEEPVDSSIPPQSTTPSSSAERWDEKADCQRETNVFGYVRAVVNSVVYIDCERDHHFLAPRSREPKQKAHRAETEPFSADQESSQDDEDDTPQIRTRVERFTLKATVASLEPLLQVGDYGVAREPRRHVNAADERKLFVTRPFANLAFVPVPLMQGELCTIRGIVNYPRLDPGVSTVWTKSRGPCYFVAPRRELRNGNNSAADGLVRVALVPVIFVDADAEAKVDAELNEELAVLLDRRVNERFAASAEERYVRNVELQAKKAQVAARMAARLSEAERLKPRVETWGGGLALTTEQEQRKRVHGALQHTERADVSAALHRDRTAAQTSQHASRDFVLQFDVQHKLLQEATDALRATLPKAK